jgi:hypothetical protein
MISQTVSGHLLQDAFVLGRLIPPYFGFMAAQWWKLELKEKDYNKSERFFNKELGGVANRLQIKLAKVPGKPRGKKLDVETLFAKQAQNWCLEIKENIDSLHHPATGEALMIGFFSAWTDWMYQHFASDDPLPENLYHVVMARAVLGIRQNVRYCPIPMDIIELYFRVLRKEDATWKTISKSSQEFIEKLFAWFDSFDSPHGVPPKLDRDFLLIKPIWKGRGAGEFHDRAFVLMPFSVDWSEAVYQATQTSLEALGIECRRADVLFGSDIVEEIWQEILEASLIIADLTGGNPNVFYELGLAHAIGKECILLSQSSKFIPFDLNRFRHIIYSPSVRGIQNLSSNLKQMAKQRLLGKTALLTPIPW